MKLLITGGTGFLGQHVSSRLIKETDEYYIRFITPSSSQLDLTNRLSTINFILDYKPDVILHMAALCGGILANKKRPADFLHKNLDMSSNIFDAALKAKCQYIYTLGSVCSYPKYCPTPFKEDSLWNGYPEETNAPYGIAKRVLLMLSQTYREQYNIGGAHLIPVNLYGEHDHFDLTNSHVIPALINKFTNAKEKKLPYVECWGTGEATREFLYAGDAAQAIVKSVLSNLDYEQPINLGTGVDISIKELANLIKGMTNYKGEIHFTGEVSDGQPKRVLDVSRAKKMLDWAAETNLIEGLQKTINWYRSDR